MSNTIPTTKAAEIEVTDGWWWITTAPQNEAEVVFVGAGVVYANNLVHGTTTATLANFIKFNPCVSFIAPVISPSEQAAENAGMAGLLRRSVARLRNHSCHNVCSCPTCELIAELAALIAQLSSGVTAQAQADKRDEAIEKANDEIETLKGQLNDWDIDLRAANLEVSHLNQHIGVAREALQAWSDHFDELDGIDFINGDHQLLQERNRHHRDRIKLTRSALASLSEAKEETC